MQARRIVFLFLLLTLFNRFHVCFAQEKEIDKDTQADIKQQISDLEKRVREMERQHAIEIQELNEKLQALSREQEEKAEEDAIADLRRQAEADAAKEEVAEEPKQTIFQAGWLSLQDLNPEISVTGDMFYQYTCRDGVGHSDFVFRNLGLHFQAYLDPYTRFKAAVPVNEHGAELGEAYLTRFGIVHGLNGTAGKFRQQFGVVNRWHKHALDQLDFPLALRQIFGEGGLNQTGISLDYTLPPFGNSIQEVTLQVTNGENKRLFSGNFVSLPATLLHYKNYRDLTKDTYLEWGLTGLVGWNDEWDVLSGDSVQQAKDTLSTWVFGADLCLLWEPTERMRYRNIEWRTEAYVLYRNILAPDGSGNDTLNAWGAYSYVQGKLSRRWVIGVRGDYYEPDTKDYAALPGLSLAPLAYTSSGVCRWGITPYVTWYQSPWVRVRFEYEHLDGHGTGEAVDGATLQLTFAAGPHKHDRY